MEMPKMLSVVKIDEQYFNSVMKGYKKCINNVTFILPGKPATLMCLSVMPL